MSQQLAIEVLRQVLMTTLWLSLPLLAILFIVGIIISLLQILTSIQDPSFGAVPRLAAFFIALMIVMPWMMMRVVAYTEQLFSNLAKYAH